MLRLFRNHNIMPASKKAYYTRKKAEAFIERKLIEISEPTYG